MGADEGDYLELLIANQRILDWIDQLKASMGPQKSVQKRKHIIMQLKSTVEEKAAYAEEAQKSGAVQVLTSILRTTDDEELMDAISSIIAACNGPLASGGKVSDFMYGGISVQIREGALGDGLGAKVWTVAHMLCRVLAGHPYFVQGHRVLEIGSGCGVCGILAAKLGAQRVDLTDVEGPVLRNLRDCVRLNNDSISVEADHTLQAGVAQPQQLLPSDADLFDDADSVEGSDLGALLAADAGDRGSEGSTWASDQKNKEREEGAVPAVGPSCQNAWEAGNMRVSLLDWLESLQWQRQQQQQVQQVRQHLKKDGEASKSDIQQQAAEQPPQHAWEHSFSCNKGLIDPKEFYANDILRTECVGPLQGEMPPRIDLQTRFPRIIGTDIMYEPLHAVLVAAVLAHRLERGGCALLCCAVRQVRTFVAFQEACTAQNLRYRWLQMEPETEDLEGIGGRRNQYDK